MGPLGAKSIINKLSWETVLAAKGNHGMGSQWPLPGAPGLLPPRPSVWRDGRPLQVGLYLLSLWETELQRGQGPGQHSSAGQGRASSGAALLTGYYAYSSLTETVISLSASV